VYVVDFKIVDMKNRGWMRGASNQLEVERLELSSLANSVLTTTCLVLNNLINPSVEHTYGTNWFQLISKTSA